MPAHGKPKKKRQPPGVRSRPVSKDRDRKRKRRTPSLYDRLRNVVGKAKGPPPDASLNHDHYLYGYPKK
jgi:hypothetical protein